MTPTHPHTHTRTQRRRLLLAGLVGALLASLRPAGAQTNINADAGLDTYGKSGRWLPLQLTVTNQGAATRVEARAHFQEGLGPEHEYRTGELRLQGSANERHTLYMRAPLVFGGGAQSPYVEFLREGRPMGLPARPRLNLVTEGNWLVVGVGASENTAALKLLTTTNIGRAAPHSRPNMSGGNQHQISVAALESGRVPDRWQGLEAADVVVLGNVSEREFTPDQQGALRDYVSAGGTLVVTGGGTWNRLTTPFFADLLPVQVNGARTATSVPGLRALMPELPEGRRAFTVCTASPKPGCRVDVSDGGMPIVARGYKGSGQVVYMAFDPSLPPFQAFPGIVEFWKRVMAAQPAGQILGMVAATEDDEEYARYGMAYNGNQQFRLADAPFAISQLDIPAFYIVALFLLAYIIVLVPVNYYFLKARDRKEYAWLTTPAIVLLFSFGAYMIGYGFKGGRTLLARVGVIEAHAGQDSAPALTYSGLFSPRKTSYEIQLAANDPLSQAEAASTLLSEPESGRNTAGLRVVGGDAPKVSDFAVDMWAMRVLKTEGMVRLGKGVAANLSHSEGRISGTVANNTSYTLDDCCVLIGGQVVPIGKLAPGATAGIPATTASFSSSGTVLPPQLLSSLHGSREEQRMKRAVLQPICVPAYAMQNGWQNADHPLLIGWVQQPIAQLLVDGRPPREQAANLMVVHLDMSR